MRQIQKNSKQKKYRIKYKVRVHKMMQGRSYPQ